MVVDLMVALVYVFHGGDLVGLSSQMDHHWLVPLVVLRVVAVVFVFGVVGVNSGGFEYLVVVVVTSWGVMVAERNAQPVMPRVRAATE